MKMEEEDGHKCIWEKRGWKLGGKGFYILVLFFLEEEAEARGLGLGMISRVYIKQLVMRRRWLSTDRSTR